MSQQSAFTYIRSGVTPFFRLPSGEAPYDAYDAVVLGVPYDGGTTMRPGARFAPYEVRRASARIQCFHPQHRLDVFRALRVVDGGNVPAPPFSGAAVRELVEGMLLAVVESDATPFVVGGDHSITLPILRAIARKHGPVAVIHVDAHLDTSTGELWGDEFHHGTPIRHALLEGLIERGQLHQVGIRASFGHPEESALSLAYDARIYDMDAIDDRGVVAVADQIRSDVGDRAVYLTFDVDGVDPSFAPGTGTPESGGMSAREALRFVRALAGVRLVGMDVVEVLPALDHADLTVDLAARLLFEGLALRAVRASRTSPA